MLSHAHVRSIIYSRNSERTNGRRCWREKRASELFDDGREGKKKKKKKKKKKRKKREKKQREQDPKFSDVVESFERGNVIETLILPVYRFLSSQFLAKIARDTLQLISHLTFTRRI